MIPWDPDNPRNRRRCQNCGSHVTAAFRATAGDSEGYVHSCPNCSTYRAMWRDESPVQEAPADD